MQTVFEQHSDAHRRPAALDLIAAALLVATVVLHVVAMFPTYYVGYQPLAGQPDQAALYAIVAAAWALVLAVGLAGPHRTPIAASLAAGVALGEVGFRLSDLGAALNLGTRFVGTGFWIMDAAWVVGALAALLAALAAHRRHRSPRPVASVETAAATDTRVLLAVNPYDPTGSELVAQSDAVIGDGTDVMPVYAGQIDAADGGNERLAWTLLVAVLAALAAGAFLPAWEHGEAVFSGTGQIFIDRNFGNAFSGPWAQVVGTVVAGAMFLLVPMAAIRLRNKAVGAAAVVGVLIVLTAQLVSAVVQANLAQPLDFGLNASEVSQYGIALSLKLTGWFTVDALAAYALFAVVMVWANLHTAEEPVPAAWVPTSSAVAAIEVPPAPPAPPPPTRDPAIWP